jgi:hemin uptake protein HemP
VAPNEPERAEKPEQNSTVTPRQIRSVQSADLFQGDREIRIEHAGDAYRLRITKTGKLILFK